MILKIGRDLQDWSSARPKWDDFYDDRVLE